VENSKCYQLLEKVKKEINIDEVKNTKICAKATLEITYLFKGVYTSDYAWCFWFPKTPWK
jgi:hypothetical protein